MIPAHNGAVDDCSGEGFAGKYVGAEGDSKDDFSSCIELVVAAANQHII